MDVPFFRPDLGTDEIDEVVATLKSGWLTTGPRARRFEEDFAAAVGAKYAIALNSCTAALHLALDALGVRAGDAILIPTNTFAATAEVVRYFGAHPILVDCEPETTNISFADAEAKIALARSGRLPAIPADAPIIGIIPVHVGGFMVDLEQLATFAAEHDLWVVEDSAHAFPAAWRANAQSPWQAWGEHSKVVCYSFYANKTITTGEGGMAVTNDAALAQKMRMMSLHGLSNDAWKRFEKQSNWDYKIIAPGYKYNLTDIAAAIGIHQLRRAEEMRRERERIARIYRKEWSDVDGLEVPPESDDRIHSWHLFPIRLNLERLQIDRNQFMEEMSARGIKTSVHWRPLHLHPYYQDLGWKDGDCPTSTREWARLVSVPLFSLMTAEEIEYLIGQVRELCREFSSVAPAAV